MSSFQDDTNNRFREETDQETGYKDAAPDIQYERLLNAFICLSIRLTCCLSCRMSSDSMDEDRRGEWQTGMIKI